MSGRFFYSANSGLYRAKRDVFKAANPCINDDNFLGLFAASGCYLTDLYPKPVDHLDTKSRRRARVTGEQLLPKNSSGFDQTRSHGAARDCESCCERGLAGEMARGDHRTTLSGKMASPSSRVCEGTLNPQSMNCPVRIGLSLFAVVLKVRTKTRARFMVTLRKSPLHTTLRNPVIFAPVDIFRYGTERHAGKRADQDYAPMPD